ncbi:MAG: hypothetical protein ABJA78_20450 [Ferruginibacter sp.]
MKPFAPAIFVLLLSFTSFTTSAQKTVSAKQAFFNAYPAVINCNTGEIAKIFNTTENQAVSIPLSGNFSFTGTVTSSVIKYSNLQTVIIKSSLFDNAVFSISKRTNPDNSISYVGRILNQSYRDGYELKQTASGNYKLIKIETGNRIQDCSQP